MLRQDMQKCSGDGASNANIIRTKKERMEGSRGSFQLNILMDELLQGGTRWGMAAVEEKSRR
jgi:hypothetical protein